MTFQEELWITFIDSGLLALIALVAGFGLNWRLERRKAADGLRQSMSPFRAEAYKTLWAITEQVGFAKQQLLSPTVRRTLHERLTPWYYEAGGAMFLSHAATTQFLTTRAQLLDLTASDEDIRRSFSRLRTQLKQDCGIYTRKEANTSVFKNDDSRTQDDISGIPADRKS